MVRDTPPSQDASTHQIWNSYLKEYRRYAPETKRNGRTDRQRDYYMPPKAPLGTGHKKTKKRHTKNTNYRNTNGFSSLKTYAALSNAHLSRVWKQVK